MSLGGGDLQSLSFPSQDEDSGEQPGPKDSPPKPPSFRRLVSIASGEVFWIACGLLALLFRLPFTLAVPHYVSVAIAAALAGDKATAVVRSGRAKTLALPLCPLPSVSPLSPPHGRGPRKHLFLSRHPSAGRGASSSSAPQASSTLLATSETASSSTTRSSVSCAVSETTLWPRSSARRAPPRPTAAHRPTSACKRICHRCLAPCFRFLLSDTRGGLPAASAAAISAATAAVPSVSPPFTLPHLPPCPSLHVSPRVRRVRPVCQEVAFFDKASSGELASRLSSDCNQLSSDLTWVFRFTLEAVVRVVGVTAYLFWAQWQLGLIAVVLVPVFSYASKIYGAGTHIFPAPRTRTRPKRLIGSGLFSGVSILAL